MDKVIDVRFERMEKALANLVDSIAKYTPSTHAATELNAASADLAQGLEELQTHQRNHARIQQLRAVSAGLDGQIKDTLVQLAQARKELTGTSTTRFPDKGTYPINYTELLNYGRHIAKTTVPPSGVANAPPGGSAPPTQPESAVESAAATPGGTPNGVASAPNGALDQLSGQQNTTALPDHIQDSLNPLANAMFVPWPSEAHIRNGALAQLDFLSSRGINPEGYDPDEEEAEKKRKEEEERAREEQERLEREEKERRIREQMELARAEREKAREKEAAEREARGDTSNDGAQSSGGAAAAGSGAGGNKQAQFQFLNDDDDESD
ncbi:vitamin-D-receptor interacting mediator subunit 4-domain-containing protein [Apiospora aurea]|uniref:Mediator of RNA polymerase II transcription subunit 4 n=1 Tax=Apiospora aurea TaxID=335848 RepID=A0ABR1QKW4_9PEZI